jgi:hypothetical protein
MKNLILIIGFTVALIFIKDAGLNAQPVLTADSINPVPGNSFTVSAFLNVVNAGMPGKNKIWDFSSFGSGGTVGTLTVDSAQHTPYSSVFPNANVFEYIAGVTDAYFATSDTALRCYGEVSDTTWSVPEDFLRYPFTYDSSYTESITISGITGTYAITADGYGTLITPGDTFNNCLRVHYNLHVSNGTQYIVSYGYRWYVNGIHNYVAQIDSEQPGPGWSGTYLSPAIDTTTGIRNVNAASQITIFPNPAGDYVTISVSENLIGSWLQITDAVGRNIIRLPITAAQYRLQTGGLAKGVYLVKVSDNGNAGVVNKLVVE